jgi:hypothetical protein
MVAHYLGDLIGGDKLAAPFSELVLVVGMVEA